MLAKLHVVSQAEYDRWLSDRTADLAKLTMTPERLGRTLYGELGCKQCHSLNGAAGIGPTFLKLWQSERHFADGTTAVADENYIQESIRYPGKKVVQGFANGIMPGNFVDLPQDQISGLIAFIKLKMELLQWKKRPKKKKIKR